MSSRKAPYLILLTLAILAAVLAGIIWYQQKETLQAVFFDVGQGDAILIQQGSNQVLIDGGPDGKKVMEKLGEYVPFWDRNIEVIIATHPDQDHIDGLVDVMENYQVGEVIDNGVSSDSQIYKKYQDVIATKSSNRIEGKSGMEIRLSDDAILSILSPDGNQNKENPKDTNATSIISRLNYKSQEFLFTGDITSEQEQMLIASGQDIDVDILKISHHGSKYATSDEFLKAVSPAEAVISVGKNNRYGHPSPEVLDRLDEHRVIIKRTDLSGDIEYEL